MPSKSKDKKDTPKKDQKTKDSTSRFAEKIGGAIGWDWSGNESDKNDSSWGW